MTDIIDMHQRKFDNYLSSFVYNRESTFDKCVRPFVKDLLSELKTFPTRTIVSSPIDIYTEAITCFIIDEYIRQVTPTKLPNECYLLMLMRYPYFINILQCQRTFKEYISFRKSLLETLNLSFPTKITPQVINVSELLSTDIESVYDIRKCSVIHYFHYFVGFRFDKQFVAITKDKLPAERGVISYLVINLSYNLQNTNAIVLYHDNQRIRDKFIDETNIPKYKCIEKPKRICKSDLPFIVINSEFEQIDKCQERTYILLCYNDSQDLSQCHYTIALFGNDGYVTEQFVNDFIKGKIPMSITADEINNQLNTTFLKSFSEDPEPMSSLMHEYESLKKITAESFDNVHSENIADIQLFDMLIKEILADERLKNVLDNEELPFFKLYLAGMMNIYSEYLNSSSLKHIVCEYVCNYIYENLITNKLVTE